MGTPDRSQIDTPISKIEESPFSNFANSLSPIKPVKAIHISQTFSSLNFTSPPSVFTSPHVSHQKESRFLRRHQLSELSKPDFCTSELKEDGGNEGVLISTKQPDHPMDEGFIGTGQAMDDASAEPLGEDSKLEVEMPMALRYDSNSPNSLTAPLSGAETEGCEQDMLALVPFDQQTPRGGSFGTESNAQPGNDNREGVESGWQGLISNVADLLNFESPNTAAVLQGPFKKHMDGETSFFASVLSNCPHDHVNELQQVHNHSDVSFSEPLLNANQLDQTTDAKDMDQISQGEDNLASPSMTEGFSANGIPSEENESVYNLHRGMRRRCLVYENPGAQKNIKGGLASISLKSSNEEEMIVAACMTPVNMGGESSHHSMPGIGLHLNSLAIAARDPKYFKHEVQTSDRQPSSLVITCKSFHPPTTNEPLATSVSTALDKETDHVDNDNQLTVYASQATESASNQEFNQNSPKKKRRKSENNGETEACKRCNCKKSKCLKLYCECFAAGVYCTEPCSCQDCFNKPIHEDTVLATRKQIESRNPLAFAPKVIRGADSVSDLGQDDSTRTPASARHKRGCNCKKSNCLKKYCECYQGGVGCSVSCRCEGCKNAFGRKDGCISMGTEYEMDDVTPASEKSLAAKRSDQNRIHNDDEQNSEFTIPETPLIPFRSSLPLSLPATSKGKPPRSSCQVITSSGLHPGGDELGRSTFLRPQQSKMEKHLQPHVSGDDMPAHLQNSATSPSRSSIKTLSPNSKRISPPHHDIGQSPSLRSSRKLILQSIPSFPSLTPRR